jgi:hypothetical protein
MFSKCLTIGTVNIINVCPDSYLILLLKSTYNKVSFHNKKCQRSRPYQYHPDNIEVLIHSEIKRTVVVTIA